MQLVRNGYRLRWAIAVFGHDQIGFTAAWVVALECVRPVQKDDHICILLDGARFTEVSQHRLLVGALLWASVELAHGNYRNFELFGQKL